MLRMRGAGGREPSSHTPKRPSPRHRRRPAHAFDLLGRTSLSRSDNRPCSGSRLARAFHHRPRQPSRVYARGSIPAHLARKRIRARGLHLCTGHRALHLDRGTGRSSSRLLAPFDRPRTRVPLGRCGGAEARARAAHRGPAGGGRLARLTRVVSRHRSQAQSTQRRARPHRIGARPLCRLVLWTPLQ